MQYAAILHTMTGLEAPYSKSMVLVCSGRVGRVEHSTTGAWGAKSKKRACLHGAAGRCGAGKAGEELGVIEQALVEVLGQVGVRQAAVPVLDDVPAVHDGPKDVAQVLPRAPAQ